MSFGPVLPSASSLRDSLYYYAQGLYRELSTKNVFLWAQAIAFKVLVTVVPIVLLATGLVGRLLRGKDAFAAVARFLRRLLPPNQSQPLIDFLEQLQTASDTIVSLGGIGLFLSALSLFVTLRIAVSNAFEQNWHEERSLLRGYLFDARMVLQVGLLFVLTVGLSVALPSFFSQFVSALPGDATWLEWLWSNALNAAGLLLPLLITMAMFFQLYYLVPLPHPRKRSALSGAFIAALLWEGAKQAFTYYATYVGQFDQYQVGADGLTGALGNTFGFLIAFVFWVYFSSIVLMVGAVVASLHEHRHVTAGHLPGDEPPPEALPVAEGSPAAPPPAPDSSDAPPDPPPETAGLSAPSASPPTDASS